MIKKKIFNISLLLFVLVIIFYGIYKYDDVYTKNYEKNRSSQLEMCRDSSNLLCNKVMEEYNEYKSCIDIDSKYCKDVVKRYETYDLTNKEILDSILTAMSLSFTMVTFILLILSCIYFSYYFTNSTIKNYLNRTSYNKYIKGILKGSLKFIFIIPLIIVGYLLYACIFTKDFSLFINKEILLYLVYLILSGIYCVNLSMLSSIGSKNYIMSFTKCLIMYFISIFVCGSINMLLRKININVNQINIFDINIPNNILLYLIVMVLLVLFTGSIIYFIFRNKERVVVLLEKSEGENEN